MTHVFGEDDFEMAAAEDEEPVQAFPADGCRVHLFVQCPDLELHGAPGVGTTIGETGGSRLVEVPTSGAIAPPLSREAAGQSAHRVFGPNRWASTPTARLTSSS